MGMLLELCFKEAFVSGSQREHCNAGEITGPDCAELIGGGIHVKNILMTENKSGQEKGLGGHSGVI